MGDNLVPNGLPIGSRLHMPWSQQRRGKAWFAMDEVTVDHEQPHYPPGETALRLGLKGACPRCGKGKLFAGWLKLAQKCEVCGLDFGFADPADGPAFFGQWAGCIPAVIFALWLEAAHQPPWWVHLFTTLPLLVIPCLLLLRPLKGWLVCAQYINKAEEGRLIWHDKANDQAKP